VHKGDAKNPYLAVILAVLPEADRKYASKLGIALAWAIKAGGGLVRLRKHRQAEGDHMIWELRATTETFMSHNLVGPCIRYQILQYRQTLLSAAFLQPPPRGTRILDCPATQCFIPAS